MSSFFKGLALLVALSCLVWVGVIWHWQTSQRDMSVQDIVMYLGVLPVVLFVLVLLGRWALRGAAARAAAVPAAAAPTTAAAATAPPPADEAARKATWQLLAAHGHTTLGATPEDWAAAAEAQAPGPELDAELRDAQGLPVMTARVPKLDLTEVQAELEAPLAQAASQHPALQPGAAFLRALALLRAPLAEAVSSLAPWSARLSAPPKEPASARVRVLVAWPAGWNALEQDVAARWLQQCLVQAGDGIVAAARWTPAPPGAAPSTGAELWLQADALFEAMRREERQDVVLLLATHSDLTEDAVARLEAAGRLFSSQRPKGMIPGEAAVALLLAPANWPADEQAAAAPAHLHRAAVAARDKPVDGAGRIAHKLLPGMLQQALSVAGLQAAELTRVANDADQHTPRGAELFGALVAELPHLDAAEDVHMVGQLSGSLGPCGPLLVAALAAHTAQRHDCACLSISVSDPTWRSVLVARPQPPAPPTPLAPPAT